MPLKGSERPSGKAVAPIRDMIGFDPPHARQDKLGKLILVLGVVLRKRRCVCWRGGRRQATPAHAGKAKWFVNWLVAERFGLLEQVGLNWGWAGARMERSVFTNGD